jgi:hypothetical protein
MKEKEKFSRRRVVGPEYVRYLAEFQRKIEERERQNAVSFVEGFLREKAKQE